MGQGQVVQKVLAIIILLLIPIFILKEYKNLTLSKNLSVYRDGEPLKNEYSKTENKFFVIIVFSDEKNSFCEKNLESIFTQSYPYFRVVYLGSGEGLDNYDKAQNFIAHLGYKDRVTFIKNPDGEKFFDMFYRTIHDCKDEEVIIHLEGTDWLANKDVLEKLNKAYLDPDVWLTYGDCMEYPSLKKQELEPTVNRTLRDFRAEKTPWMLSHLKTYYAGLLKQLTPNVEGLKEKAISSEDKMLMLSLLKIGKWHVRFIPEVLSIHQENKQEETGVKRFVDRVAEQKKYFSPRKSINPSLVD